MIRRALCLLLCLLLLPACAPVEGTRGEPYAGCLLAAANRREVIRAAAYLHPAIPARILCVRFAGAAGGHAALIYRLDPEGWCGYEDTFGSRPLGLPASAPLPAPMEAAQRLFGPGQPVAAAAYLVPPPAR